jgi:hypothetical protein
VTAAVAASGAEAAWSGLAGLIAAVTVRAATDGVTAGDEGHGWTVAVATGDAAGGAGLAGATGVTAADANNAGVAGTIGFAETGEVGATASRDGLATTAAAGAGRV